MQPTTFRYQADDPFGHIRPSGRAHTGSDWACPTGSPVYAVLPGVVTATGWNDGNGYYVAQTLPDGRFWSYIHLSDILVKVGQQLREGDIVARSGNTGSNSQGPHLHCSLSTSRNVFVGAPTLADPYAFLTQQPPPPTPKDDDMAQGAFYRANPAIYWQEKPNTAFTALSLWTWNAYAAQGNRYIEIPKAELDALIKKYGLIPSPPTK